ncbi:helix-turn-helix domain-containing protein [Streptomyces noursei]|uniref:helix-turn-helix domain-containing protein n=1 Tax=Streptomyces noursei TaxID=1971 RepID=UPI00381EE979
MTDLGAFLRSKRATMRPEDFGMPSGLSRRRVPGLRREELALLAGISPDYYIRLEQGRGRNVSASVLDAVADALCLDDDERTYLHNLARPAVRRTSAPRPQQVRPGLLRLLDALYDVPAFILGRRMDILESNDLARAVIGDFDGLPAEDHNAARLVFLHDGAERYPDFDTVARQVVGNLRAYAGRHPDDPEMPALIGELSLRSQAFRELWAEHTVRECTQGSKRVRHPAVGEFTVTFETLCLPDDPDQSLVTYTADPGSDDEVSLRLLAGWVNDASLSDQRRRTR